MKEKTTQEIAHKISSQSIEPKKACLYYQKQLAYYEFITRMFDVTFKEDDSRIRQDEGSEVNLSRQGTVKKVGDLFWSKNIPCTTLR